jgi:hypothetical protein
MFKWDYRVIPVRWVHIGNMTKQGFKPIVRLDPRVNNWGEYGTFQYSNEALYARLAYSDNDYWTFLSDCLQDMGENGWELVGTTPPLFTPAAGSGEHTEFHLLFKRIRTKSI